MWVCESCKKEEHSSCSGRIGFRGPDGPACYCLVCSPSPSQPKRSGLPADRKVRILVDRSDWESLIAGNPIRSLRIIQGNGYTPQKAWLEGVIVEACQIS